MEDHNVCVIYVCVCVWEVNKFFLKDQIIPFSTHCLCPAIRSRLPYLPSSCSLSSRFVARCETLSPLPSFPLTLPSLSSVAVLISHSVLHPQVYEASGFNTSMHSILFLCNIIEEGANKTTDGEASVIEGKAQVILEVAKVTRGLERLMSWANLAIAEAGLTIEVTMSRKSITSRAGRY